MPDFQISRSANYQTMYIRERADAVSVPLERTKPVESWGVTILSTIGFVMFLVAVIYFI